MRLVLAIVLALVLAPQPAPQILVSFTSSSTIIYPPQRFTLTVQVSTDSIERVPVWMELNTTYSLQREEGIYAPWMSLCDDENGQEVRCFPWVSSAEPITLSMDLHVRASALPGIITPTLRVWPMSGGLSAMITQTLPLIVIEPWRVYLPC